MPEQPTATVARVPILAYDTPRKIRRLSRLAIVMLICGSIAGPLAFVPTIGLGVLWQLVPEADNYSPLIVVAMIVSVLVLQIGIIAMGVKTLRRIEKDPCLRGRKYAYYGTFMAMFWLVLLLFPLMLFMFICRPVLFIRLMRSLLRADLQMGY